MTYRNTLDQEIYLYTEITLNDTKIQRMFIW